MRKDFTRSDFNHEQRRKNIEKYLEQINSTHPELHLFKKNGTPHKKNLAAYWGLPDSRTILKFFKEAEPGEKGPVIDNWTYHQIAAITNIHEAYWRGLTTEQDGAVYEKRLEAEEKTDELERLQAEKHRNEVKRLTTFFDLLGYGYECSDDWNDDPLGIKELHTITKKGTSDSQHLSEEDLQKVLDEAAGFLDYALYKIRRE